MKKIIIFILTIFTVATLFAAARPSLDGRAVVADAGSMPRGLFARTVGYLPGDSVTVTNPATGSTVDVLILGAIDPSEGVAILLSPEAADGLRIKPNSNVQVKLTKRSGSLDENANGSAVLSDVAEESFAKSEAAAEAENEPSYDEIPAVAETPASVEPSPAAEVVETPVETAAETVVETPVVVAAVPAPVPYSEEGEPAELEPMYEEVPALQEDNLEKVTEESLAPSEDEKIQKVVLVEEEPAIAESAVVAENEPVAVIEENLPAAEHEYVSEAAVDYEVEPSVTVEVAEAEAEENAENADDAYQPIILVPTEPNPPVAETEVVAEAVAEEKEVVEEKPAEPVKAVSEVKPPVSNDWTNYVVPSLKNLRSGSYYVQVASLGNTDNIKSFVDKYSSKYPIVLVQNSTKTSYQMMVGPLNIDEYGSVDEKFKAYGFKDAFVRKIR